MFKTQFPNCELEMLKKIEQMLNTEVMATLSTISFCVGLHPIYE